MGPYTQLSDYIPKRHSITHATTMQELNMVDLGNVSKEWGVNAMSFDAEAPDGAFVDLYIDNVAYATAV